MSTEELLKTLKREYLESLPQKISEIQRYLITKDFSSLQNAFHKLKGSGKTYGFDEISDIGFKVEECLKKDPNSSLDLVKQAIVRLESIYGTNK